MKVEIMYLTFIMPLIVSEKTIEPKETSRIYI